MCTAMSPGQWQPWKALSPLLGLISMAVWWATSLITFTSPPYKSRRSGLLTVLPDDVSKASKAYKRCKACIKLNYVTENLAPRTPRSCTGLGKLVKCNAMRAQEGPLKIADKIRSLKRRKIDEIYFFSVFRLVINKPNDRFLSLILGFAVTVAIWRGSLSLATISFYVLSLAGI